METLGEATPAEQYFVAVEALFARLRGRPLLLAPRDVSLVKQWHDAGVPLAAVELGLERFFERESRRSRPRRRPPTLEYCEKDVYESFEDWKAARLGASAAGTSPGPIESHLGALPGRLDRACQAVRGMGAPGLARALEAASERVRRLGAAGAGQGEEIEGALGALDAELLRAARAELDGETLHRISERVREDLTALTGGMDENAQQLLRQKAEDRAILNHFGVPRLSLFAF